MKALKILGIVFAVYVGIVALFESLLGYYQPAGDGTMTIVTQDGDQRVVAQINSGGALYVAANHWPRAWYRETLEQPQVKVLREGVGVAHVAVPVTGDEYERVNTEHHLPLTFRILTGFPPRRLLRLDPV